MSAKLTRRRGASSHLGASLAFESREEADWRELGHTGRATLDADLFILAMFMSGRNSRGEPPSGL